MSISLPPNETGYCPGHPWYYVRGGKVLSLKQIRFEAEQNNYRGYMPDRLDEIDTKPEPKRSHSLRQLREKVREDLKRDVSGYRKQVNRLRRYRDHGALEEAQGCNDVHTAISLKHNHLYNDFAILREIETMLTKQRDLFDL
ncbi:hypothetical protein FF098_017370 [Parvularcula flava]|uniref:Uncharacterized protein n=1 Tax=Aquisalinus luteolus TaxID=1566827 RepID=A0A8J3ESS7_9PROT|nr:hypothetical protein [Aquisalinus luteolus]NHK29680.1 hypothetical protein [Aquisalinus luteolus]GGI02127.1 hypothetical protein GCM10011355_34390 [Aquisalinus luteolus]